MSVRACQPATGRIRLTYRFAALARSLSHDEYLELRTRWLIAPCTSMTRQLQTRAPDLHLLQTGSWDNDLGGYWDYHRTDWYVMTSGSKLSVGF